MLLMEFSKYLEIEFLKWQQDMGGRKTIDDFASYLEISRPLLSMYLNGKRSPGKENIDQLAEKLGLEVYDALGLERPDPDLFYIQKNWAKLSNEQQERIRDLVEGYFAHNVGVSFDEETNGKPIPFDPDSLAISDPSPTEPSPDRDKKSIGSK